MQHDREQLVAIIRGVHEALRKNYQRTSGDHDTVWTDHLHDVDKRLQYSRAMFELATTAWLEKNTRITWCHQTCIDYFFGGKLERLMEKTNLNDQKIDEKYFHKKIDLPFIGKIKLLDVGSCYNPFSIYPEYQCLAIDLTPAVESVSQCDFLQVKILPFHTKSMNLLHSDIVTELYECTFDVVIFSLVLEYLPAPKQRFTFCQKAWKLLKYNGLLLIVTPDSKKQHCNAPMMKKWKLALNHIGFQRIAYEKQRHMHCMAFRKLFDQSNTDTNDIIDLLSIPQDFHHYADDDFCEEQKERTEEENENILTCFTELPAFI